jgi:DNA-binding transcriptional ArsR family regulator
VWDTTTPPPTRLRRHPGAAPRLAGRRRCRPGRGSRDPHQWHTGAWRQWYAALRAEAAVLADGGRRRQRPRRPRPDQAAPADPRHRERQPHRLCHSRPDRSVCPRAGGRASRARVCRHRLKVDPVSPGRLPVLVATPLLSERVVELGRRGRKRHPAVEDEYWKLVLEGVGTVEACRQVGIGRKTGDRWRAERGGLPPLRLGEADRTGRYLSQLERQRIATLRDRGVGVREIARRLGRSPSTVSRELRRNLRPHDGGVYDGDLAHARARERARRNRAGRLSVDHDLRQVVQDKLELEWSPEQIAAWLRLTYPDRSSWHVCHETIYQAIYHGGHAGLSRQLTKRLRTGRPLRKRRRRANQRTPRFIAPVALVDRRPAVVETPGHGSGSENWRETGRLAAEAVRRLYRVSAAAGSLSALSMASRRRAVVWCRAPGSRRAPRLRRSARPGLVDRPGSAGSPL